MFTPSKLFKHELEPSSNGVSVAVLNVDCDPSAEFLMVTDRSTFKTLRVINLQGGHIAKVVLPVEFATTSLVAATIFDSDKQYNAAITDGITCELIGNG